MYVKPGIFIKYVEIRNDHKYYLLHTVATSRLAFYISTSIFMPKAAYICIHNEENWYDHASFLLDTIHVACTFKHKEFKIKLMLMV